MRVGLLCTCNVKLRVLIYTIQHSTVRYNAMQCILILTCIYNHLDILCYYYMRCRLWASESGGRVSRAVFLPSLGNRVCSLKSTSKRDETPTSVTNQLDALANLSISTSRTTGFSHTAV